MVLDSFHPRKIEFRVLLKARLTDTSSRKVLWEDRFEVQAEVVRRKKHPYENIARIVLDSLREAVNGMVSALSQDVMLEEAS
ncbi:MAG: hypothetical protein JW747_08870 [Candidatus Aminicenantes bacterium]|nr:hypothetical protein [Candidatus Aminicenantes bacterium]